MNKQIAQSISQASKIAKKALREEAGRLKDTGTLRSSIKIRTLKRSGRYKGLAGVENRYSSYINHKQKIPNRYASVLEEGGKRFGTNHIARRWKSKAYHKVRGQIQTILEEAFK